eukprot:8499182-Heterocapsa_arctica.AAC.1
MRRRLTGSGRGGGAGSRRRLAGEGPAGMRPPAEAGRHRLARGELAGNGATRACRRLALWRPTAYS